MHGHLYIIRNFGLHGRLPGIKIPYVCIEAATLARPLKCGTWVLTREWALTQDTMYGTSVCPLECMLCRIMWCVPNRTVLCDDSKSACIRLLLVLQTRPSGEGIWDSCRLEVSILGTSSDGQQLMILYITMIAVQCALIILVHNYIINWHNSALL